MRSKLAPLLFEDHDKQAGQQRRESIVKPAMRSTSADRKAARKQNEDGLSVHSFRSTLADVATLTINRTQPADPNLPTFDKFANPTPIQKQAFSLLGIKLQLPKP